MKRYLIYFLITVIYAGPLFARDITVYTVRGREIRAVRGELIVRFRSGLSDAEREAIIENLGAVKVRDLRVPYSVKVEVPGEALESIMAVLEADPGVEYAEPNMIFTSQKLPGIYGDIQDLESAQWGLARVQAPSAWEVDTGSGRAVIAVIDSGIELSHPELSENIWRNPFEEIDGTDTAGNGYKDDIYGWNFVNDNNNPNPPNTDESHGTHVAGIASASGRDGAVGMSWGNLIMPLRALAGRDGTVADITEAIYYAADNGADVINLSLGGDENLHLRDAVNYAHGKGVLLIAASGNSHPLPIAYPAAYENVIAVGASDRDDLRAPFSCYIPPTHGYRLDLVAPGVEILSTLPGGVYGSESGTSMASPFVAGLASLIISYKNDRGIPWSNDEVRRILIQNADGLNGGGYPVRDDETGYGRINSFSVMNFLATGGFAGEPADPVAFPNPFNPHSQQVILRLSERNTGTLRRFEIFSLSGRSVRSRSGLSGRSAFWDGRNDDGDLCATGLYFFVLETYEGDTEKGKVSLVR